MGDGADMAIEAMEDFENARTDFHTGAMSDLSAFELGIIDELGYELMPRGRTQLRTCRCCSKTGLHWAQHNGKWRLFDNNGLHECPKNPLKM